MFLSLLREALAQRRLNIEATRKIEEGRNLEDILPNSIETDVELRLDSRWWLEKFFDKHNLSFVQGALLIYGLAEIPRLLILLFILGRAPEWFLTAFISTFVGDLFIPIALLLVHNIYKSLLKLKTKINETLRRDQFVAPTVLISDKELASPKLLADLDKEYKNRYIKPVMFRTLQLGFDLSYEKKYQLCSGLVAGGLFLFLMFARFVLNVLPETVHIVVEPGVPEISIVYKVWYFSALCFDWFVIGMVTWTLFVTFLSSIQASGNLIRTRPFESIKEYLAPNTNLVIKTSFAVTFLTAWISPFVLVWSVLPQDLVVRQSALVFVESVVIIMTMVIVFSFLLPILKLHKSMVESRARSLLLKRYQLEDLKKIRESDPNRYLKIQRHLILDYKDIQDSPVWLLRTSQVLELIGSLLLPIITFLISVRV